MAEPVVWKDKDVITAEKLNQMQQVQGPKGETGAPGKNGVDGKQGPKGDPGTNGKDGATGPAGKDGSNGAKGADGKSIKGGVINTDKNNVVTGGVLTFTDDTTVSLTVNKATE